MEQQRATRTIRPHKKFISKWAKRYVDLCVNVDTPTAIKWASDFLNPADIPEVAAEARMEMKRRGITEKS